MRMPRKLIMFAVVFGLSASPWAPEGRAVLAGAEQQPDAVTVQIDNFSFSPKEITVSKGSTVTWVNHDDVPHTVVSGGAFRSNALDTAESYAYTFNDAGTYSYFCSVHPVMTGKVVVK